MLRTSLAILIFGLAGSTGAADLRDIVRETLEQLQVIEETLYYLDRAVTRPTGVEDARGKDMFGAANSTYRDLKRAADEIARMGNEVQAMAKDCDKERKSAASDYRAATRRLQSDAGRLGSATTSSFAHMALARVRTDASEVQQGLGTIGDVEGCAEREGDEDKPKDDDQPKEG